MFMIVKSYVMVYQKAKIESFHYVFNSCRLIYEPAFNVLIIKKEAFFN